MDKGAECTPVRAARHPVEPPRCRGFGRRAAVVAGPAARAGFGVRSEDTRPRGTARRPIRCAMPATAPADPPASFESALQELEALVQRMESGDLTLEDSLVAYRRGAQLVGFCRESLAHVQQQVRVLEGDLLRPFDAEGRGEG
jgi:exodeoxyribonuclease VII small subunit